METLYRKYRPKNFLEVEGQTHIVKTLRNAILIGRVGHAYLFTGPRGTGKTTLARIFSLALNCLNIQDGNPCEKCQSCTRVLKGNSLSVIEIDAASHTGVDNIRQLREEAFLPPMDGSPYKIYIIDEVHMLSKGAFNALLKILEEPPKHIVFILATTEIQKVPETVLSRCQRFDFGRLPITNIIEKLARISKSEKVKLDPEVLEMIALTSAGGMRDAESLLSQLFSANDKHITIKEAEEILGFSHRKTSRAFITALTENNIPDALRHIAKASESGYDLDHFVETTIYRLRQMLFLRVSPEFSNELKNEIPQEEMETLLKQVTPLSLSWIVRAIDILLSARISMKSSFLPQIPLETAVVKILDISLSPDKTLPDAKKPDSPEQLPTENPTPPSSGKTDDSTIQKEDVSSSSFKKNDPPKKKKSPSTVFSLNEVSAIWKQCLNQTKEKNALLGTFLEECVAVQVKENILFVETSSEFYKNALEKTENRLTIENILSTLLNARVSLSVRIRTSSKKEQDTLIQNVLEAFGGAVG